ncbi:collectin-12 [Plakobranchus ocellatus]|uniref:Collectin-12 n=1 Tax=Plakobranchus ocellatus TaxID=259542 RepID=A0AAV3XWY6_9GAST|nr:collectin-12 [Plakobranchus ocellatus]
MPGSFPTQREADSSGTSDSLPLTAFTRSTPPQEDVNHHNVSLIDLAPPWCFGDTVCARNSAVFRDRQYSVSKYHEPFNLAKMNDRCKERGGYLLQIDDRKEQKFVARWLHYSPGVGPIYTGITDEGSEGRFYTYNDKKPAKYLKWRWWQPDNWYGEHCVTISLRGLNDLRCTRRGRYVCEIRVKV